jgi:hypothetical protein
MSVKIDQALVEHFRLGAFGLPVAYENQPFSPSNCAWASVRVLPNDVTPYSLDDCDETDGIFQVILNYPTDVGAVEPKAKADEVFSHYAIGSRVSYAGQSLTINRHQRQPGLAEDGWYRLVLSIGYIAFIER